MRSKGCFRLLTFVVIVLLACSAAAITTLRSATPVRAASVPTGLHVVGNHIVDGNGNVFIPRGVDRMGTEYACRAQDVTTDFDGPVDQAAVSAMLTWDVNAVRVPLNEDCWLGINGEPANGKTVAQYQSDIVNWVNLLNQNGLVVILDLHWNAPGATRALGQEPMPDLDHAPAFWTSVANTFKSNSSVIFDLYNEPYPGFGNGSTTGWSCWKNGSTAASAAPCADVPFAVAGMQTLVNTVRATGATNILMLGGLAYSNDLTGWLANEPTDANNNLAASVHIYNFNACNSPNCWDTQVAPVAAKVPVIAGEIGEDDCASGFINPLMAWFDAHDIGYLAWTWTVVTSNGGCILLITDYSGTPTSGYGAGYKAHLVGLAATGGPPPTTSLTSPTMGQSFTSPATITLTAAATPKNNKTITKVEFYSGSTLLGTATTSPYSFSWKGVAANSYILTAKAYDSGGASTISAPVAITVNAPGSPVIGCKLQYTMNQWNVGFSVGINLTNTGTTAFSGWTLTFSFSGNQQITQIWNGALTQTGGNVLIKDAGYNANIAPGNSTSLGFNGTYSGVNTSPTIFFLNNQACTTS